jgi:hypothetical protein
MPVTKDIKTAKSVQEIWNLGFDTEFNLPVVENLVYNPTTCEMERMVQAGQLLPTDGNNPSTVLSYDIDGNLQYIDETIGVKTYRTTLTYTGGILTSISEAVEL